MGEPRRLTRDDYYRAVAPGQPPSADPSAPITRDGCGVDDGPQKHSLDCALVRAVREADEGNWTGYIGSICDALWIAHTGSHEQMSDYRMVELLRSMAGLGWSPPPSSGVV